MFCPPLIYMTGSIQGKQKFNLSTMRENRNKNAYQQWGAKKPTETNQHSREWTEEAPGDDEFIWNKTVKHVSLMMVEKKTFTSSNSIWATEVLCVRIQSRSIFSKQATPQEPFSDI